MKVLPCSTLTLLLLILGIAYAIPPLSGTSPPRTAANSKHPAALSATPTQPAAKLATGSSTLPEEVESERSELPSSLTALRVSFARRYHDLHSAQVARQSAIHQQHPLERQLRQKDMEMHFLKLTHPEHWEAQREHLTAINALRRAGYRFGPQSDPGLHVPLGTPWDFLHYGPYPASRLAELESRDLLKVGNELRWELENAVKALDGQSYVDSMRRATEEPQLVYTDDPDLLHTATEYFSQKLQSALQRKPRF